MACMEGLMKCEVQFSDVQEVCKEGPKAYFEMWEKAPGIPYLQAHLLFYNGSGELDFVDGFHRQSRLLQLLKRAIYTLLQL
jgi:hypothetical protein